MAMSNWNKYLSWELATSRNRDENERYQHTLRIFKGWRARPDRKAYVEAIDSIHSWDRSAELWKRRTAEDLQTGRLPNVLQHRRNHYRALDVKAKSLRKLAQLQQTSDANGIPYTDKRSRRNTEFAIKVTNDKLRTLEPLIPAEDIARRLFPALDTFAPRLRAHIVESCKQLHDEINPEDTLAETQLSADLTATIALFRRSAGADFAHRPLAQDVARRARRNHYRREKTLPDSGLQRTWSKPSQADSRVPLNPRERRDLLEAPPTPTPGGPYRVTKLYRWLRGAR